MAEIRRENGSRICRTRSSTVWRKVSLSVDGEDGIGGMEERGRKIEYNRVQYTAGEKDMAGDRERYGGRALQFPRGRPPTAQAKASDARSKQRRLH